MKQQRSEERREAEVTTEEVAGADLNGIRDERSVSTAEEPRDEGDGAVTK